MDYLLSLVGKDEDTIVDAIKDLAANSEKVKAQEIEIKELINEKDEDKEEIHYLKKKLDQKYDLIEDMENELENIERKLKESQKEIELKETDLNQLKILITDQVEEINILRDNNQSMISQIAENIQMENQIKSQDEVIQDLEEKLSSGTHQYVGWKEAESDEEEENRKLQEEIKKIVKINAEKANELEKLETVLFCIALK
jgi:chromosome segregation ATPase